MKETIILGWSIAGFWYKLGDNCFIRFCSVYEYGHKMLQVVWI